MTTRQLKDTNWTSARKSIMAKYDKNGDGHFDQDEVEGIIDDYMGTIYNKQSLEDSNKTQRKIIIFGTIMIVLLSLSNLGTGIAAAYISKDITVIDGMLMAVDGDESATKYGDRQQALLTNNAVMRFDMKRMERTAMRRLQDLTVETTVACIPQDMAAAIGATMLTSGAANLGLVKTQIAGALSTASEASADLTSLISLYGSMVYSDDGTILTFPAANVKIDMSPTSECAAEGQFGVVLVPNDSCNA
jgi:hypothetical protein